MFGETFSINGRVEIILHDASGKVVKTIKQNTIVKEGLMGFLSSLDPKNNFKATNFRLYYLSEVPEYDEDAAGELAKFDYEFGLTLDMLTNNHQWVGVSQQPIKRFSDPYLIERTLGVEGASDTFRGVGFEVITTYRDTDEIDLFNVATLTVRDEPFRPHQEVAKLRKTVLISDTEISVGDRSKLNIDVATNNSIQIGDEIMTVIGLPVNKSDVIEVERTNPSGHNTWELVYRHYTPSEEKLLSYAQLSANVSKDDYFLTLKWIYELGRVFTV